jgi:hypothetical protein
MASQSKTLVPTAKTLAAFAHELEAEGFSEGRIDALLVAALEHELRQDGLTVMSVDG